MLPIGSLGCFLRKYIILLMYCIHSIDAAQLWISGRGVLMISHCHSSLVALRFSLQSLDIRHYGGATSSQRCYIYFLLLELNP